MNDAPAQYDEGKKSVRYLTAGTEEARPQAHFHNGSYWPKKDRQSKMILGLGLCTPSLDLAGELSHP